MHSLLVLVAAVASLVQAAPSYYPYAAPAPAWHGPLATPVVLPSGYLADTPEEGKNVCPAFFGSSNYITAVEVAALKAKHVAALGSAPVGAYAPAYAGHDDYTPKWHGPLAAPVVLPSGYLADTPEVVALRAAHAAAHGHGHYYH